MARGVDLSVVFHVGGQGRLAIPPIRSLERAVAEGASKGLRIEVVVVGTGAKRAATAFAESTTVLQLDGPADESAAAAVVSGIGAASGQVIALLDADVLVTTGWIAAAFEAIAELDGKPVADAELLVTFGSTREVTARPSGSDRRAIEALAVADPWGWRFAATASTLRRIVRATPASSLRDAGWLWNTRIAAAGVERGIVSRTALLVRSAPDADTNRSVAHPLMLPSALLADLDFAQSASHTTAPPSRTSPREWVERLPRPAAAVGRLAIDTVRPARDALRRSRSARHRPAVPDWLASELRVQNRFEPAVPFPRASALREYRMVAAGRRESERVAAYWRLRAALPDSVDYLFFAPWVRTGGGDLMLAHYIGAVRRLDPDARVALIMTEFSTSTRLDLLPDGVHLFELSSIASATVDREWCVEHLIPQLIAQLQPTTVHAFNSTVAFDVIERHGEVLAPASALFLSTYVVDRTPDGERTSVLFYRRDGFLDPVTAVLVDSEAFVETMTDEFGFDPAKFLVQRNIVATQFGTRDESVRGVRPFRVLWAGRFDVQKRVDVLAAVAVEISRRRLPVELHFYGEEVMGDPALPDHLRSLEAAGARRHPPFTGGFSSLPIDQYDAFLMTSEWEGVPNMMLEALAAGLPVVAPTVGGIGEVLTSEIGYPIARFDDIDAYVSTIAEILEHPDEASRRAVAARARIEFDYSTASFDSRIASTSGYLRDRA